MTKLLPGSAKSYLQIKGGLHPASSCPYLLLRQNLPPAETGHYLQVKSRYDLQSVAAYLGKARLRSAWPAPTSCLNALATIWTQVFATG